MENIMAEEEKKEKKTKVGPKAAAAMTKDEPKKETPAKEPAKKSAKSDKKKKKHGFAATHIEHHTDGSHTVRHVPDDGGQETSYASPDLNGVKAGLDQNLGGGEAAGGAEPPVEPPAGAAPALQ